MSISLMAGTLFSIMIQDVVMPPDVAMKTARAHGFALVNQLHFVGTDSGTSLAWGTPLGAPMHRRNRLILAGPNVFKVLSQVSELRGSIQIRSDDDALRFARLRTSPATCQNFGAGSPIWCEVLDSSTLTKEFTAGLADPSLFERQSFPGRFGITSHDIYQSLQIQPAKVIRRPQGFEIIRQIVEFQPRTAKFYNATYKLGLAREFIGTDGSYKVLSFHTIAIPHGVKVGWWL